MENLPMALVAEDLAITRTLVKSVLTKCGFQCVVVEEGRAAEKAFSEQKFDIAILDNQMPGKTGYELARLARNVLALKLPILIHTAEPEALPKDVRLFADVLSKNQGNIMLNLVEWVNEKKPFMIKKGTVKKLISD